nr:PREDICTED: uncharacterized protein LOC108217127 [Daucus carota subsp. sativus]
MAKDADLDKLMEDLDITNEEEEELVFDEEFEETGNRFELCVVGRFLTEKSLNVRAMKSKLADIWRPAMGISIKTLTAGLYLFQFFHKDDMQWMMNNGPWTFDNAILVTNTIPAGGDPTKVPLNEVEFWVQIYDLPTSFMTEAVGRQLGNFFGKFVLYDSSNNSSIWREYMRLKIRLDVRMPLKRRKKICKRDRTEFVVTCKYEKLGDFCFQCGVLSHTERSCKKRLNVGMEEEGKGWGGWLRAPPRRGVAQGRSKWLREENSEGWGEISGKDKIQNIQNYIGAHSGGSQRGGREELEDNMESNLQGGIIGRDKEGNQKVVQNIGPGAEEQDGLLLEDRKRQRTGPNEVMDMDKEYNNKTTDSGLSTCEAS